MNEKEAHGEMDLLRDGCCASMYLVFRKVAQSEEGQRFCLIAGAISALLNHGSQSALFYLEKAEQVPGFAF